MPDRPQRETTPRGTHGRRTTLVVGGSTPTASVSGSSAAGATESARLHTGAIHDRLGFDVVAVDDGERPGDRP